MASNYRDRTCRECAIVFSGGPRAWYCPKCREQRKKDQHKSHLIRKKKGDVRAIGSVDQCIVCGNDYIVDSGNQHYCKKCSVPAIKEVDRTQSLEYYRKEKNNINPARNLSRRKSLRTCKLCNKEFEKYGNGDYCADCRKEVKRLWQARADAKRFGRDAPTAPPKKHKIDWSNVDLTKPTSQIMQETGYKYHTILAAKKRFNI